MGRPRKNSDRIDAKERIHDAFWELLNEYKLHEITVGMLSAKAECNRGTFYYHFKDIDELVSKSIDREFLMDKNVAKVIVRAACGDKNLIGNPSAIQPHFDRLVLLGKNGGGAIIVEKIKGAVLKLWQVALGCTAEQLTPTTRLIIEYSISGILGALTYGSKSELFPLDEQMRKDVLVPFIEGNSKYLFKSICKAQGANPADVEARIKTLVKVFELSNYSLNSLSAADANLLKRVLSL